MHCKDFHGCVDCCSEDVKEFAARGIVSVTDLKSKVNRLSKA